MKTKGTDVLIHTSSPLGETQLREVANQVTAIEGVLAFMRSVHQPNFILVAYNNQQTRALSILNEFTRLGVNASLVGI